MEVCKRTEQGVREFTLPYPHNHQCHHVHCTLYNTIHFAHDVYQTLYLSYSLETPCPLVGWLVCDDKSRTH